MVFGCCFSGTTAGFSPYNIQRNELSGKEPSDEEKTDKDITDMEVNIGYELYSISIGWDVDDEGTVYDTITFEAADDDVKLDKLRCLAIIAGNENGFADEVFDYVKQYDKRRHG